MDSTITHVRARQILDSRGNPTVHATVVTASGASGSFAVPSGASTGAHEAHERRDGDKEMFGGKGVADAVRAVNHEMAKSVIGMDASDQKLLDRTLLTLDGTPNKSRLGGNAFLSVSVAAAKAAAAAKGVPVWEHVRDLMDIKPSRKIPQLFMNLVNGGLHAATRLPFQEFLIVPQTADVAESLNIGTRVMHGLKKLIRERYGAVSANIGDEGGFAPDLDDVRAPLDMLTEIIKVQGLADKVKLALDVAASSFYADGMYAMNGRNYSAGQMMLLYEELLKDYDIISIEDPFGEEAFRDFAGLARHTIVVGDDLTVTNVTRLQQALDAKSIGGIVIKLNQVGSLWETLETMKLARDNGVELFVKHRSGETNDDFIADLAFAAGAFGLMAGAPQRGERVAKYNRLWEIVTNQ
ncbi:MAG TPA: enolase C-terminal domain-like protein [Candidatus Paceibacterota bacterium]|nr:enolase C-terminal domain-like protein [Candidatus Paceibacterota bacterium]